MTQYSKQVKSTSIALLIFSLLTISIDSVLLTTQILNELLPTFGIGIFLGLFGILAGSYGICAAKATRAEHFFGKYTTSGCWSVFGGIFAFFGLAWLSFAFSCHAVCITEHRKVEEDQSAFYKKLIGMKISDESDPANPSWEEITDPDDIGWLASGTCINFQKDWTVEQTTPEPPIQENTTDIPDFGTEDWITNATEDQYLTTSEIETSATTAAATTVTTKSAEITSTTEDSYEFTTASSGTNDDTDNDVTEPEDHYDNKSIVVAYMSLYLCELVLVFILFIIFIVLSNATGCCYCKSNTVDIEADEDESYKNDSSSDEDSSDSSSDDSSDEE
jgi:energy-coupling factor transporter transmembrane protein EcfT